MSPYYYSLFLIFAIIATIMVVDSNVVLYFDLLLKFLKQKLFILKWWLFNSPSNPIVKYLTWRRSIKMAKELLKEFNQKN